MNFRFPFSDLSGYSPFTSCEFKLYDSLKEAIPVIDAAIKKTVRLVGGFKAVCEDENAQIKLAEFLRSVNVNGTVNRSMPGPFSQWPRSAV